MEQLIFVNKWYNYLDAHTSHVHRRNACSFTCTAVIGSLLSFKPFSDVEEALLGRVLHIDRKEGSM